MLVLTRKKDQALVIGDDVEITVLDIQGDQIRLGIDAPRSVKIFRKELFAEIQEENINAAKPLTRAQPAALADFSGLLKLTGAGNAGEPSAGNSPAEYVKPASAAPDKQMPEA